MKLHVNALHLKEHAIRQHVAYADEGTKIEDILKPEYWAHHAARLTALDEITVHEESGAWRAVVMVRDKGNVWAKVVLLSKNEFNAPAEGRSVKVGDDLLVDWRGPRVKWSVLRTSDNQRIKDGMATRDEALLWARDHVKALAA